MGLKTWLAPNRAEHPKEAFHNYNYLRHNARRLEHLATLGLPIAGKSVLEVGAGIGDHTDFYLDRGCQVMVTEARDDNLTILRRRFGAVKKLDMEHPELADGPFDICHCYGLLYHLADPTPAIAFMAGKIREMLLLETCVSFGDELAINPVVEPRESPSQAVSGIGCRPTRSWIFQELGKHFEHVYVTATQPDHEEFPIDWTNPSLHKAHLARAVFVASRKPLDGRPLLPALSDRQARG